MDRFEDSLARGVPSMDAEHLHLVTLFEEFAACIKKRSMYERAQQIVQEALVATNEHFEHEEAMMARIGYPGLDEEKFQHRNLRLKLTTLVGDSLNSGACDPVTLENLDDMRRLLREHIQGPDRELAEYLIAHGIQ